ncbi:4806_t:CDS:2, partial [Acaulospora colombiana]
MAAASISRSFTRNWYRAEIVPLCTIVVLAGFSVGAQKHLMWYGI